MTMSPFRLSHSMRPPRKPSSLLSAIAPVVGRDCFSSAGKRTLFGRAAITQVPSYPVTPSCPLPECVYAQMPKLDQSIHQQGSIANTAPFYGQHVVICTGKSDWASKIEEEEEEDKEDTGSVSLTRGLKLGFGRRGRWTQPSKPILITNSSFPNHSTSPTDVSASAAAAYLFPSFTYVSNIPNTAAGQSAFVEAYLLPTSSSSSSSTTSQSLFQTQPLTGPTILICSHGGRDSRCGALGPVLYASFAAQLARQGFSVTDAAPRTEENDKTARVAMVSHVGGHKWAGNVIVYLPPDPKSSSSLAGSAIWYGRVEPRHVEGIVAETLVGGRVVGELCRGVI